MIQHTSAFKAYVALGLLNSSARRAVLRELISTDNDVISVDELTTTAEPDWTPSKIELYLTHLPKLAEAGVIDWDQDSGTVRYRPSEPLGSIFEYPFAASRRTSATS